MNASDAKAGTHYRSDPEEPAAIAAANEAVRLRGDLQSLRSPDSSRADVMVIDELGGQYIRVSPLQWRQLERLGDRESGETSDRQLLAMAANAGLLRGPHQARVTPRRRFNPFMIRLPGLSVDPLSRWLAARTDWLFSPLAVIVWGLIVLAAGLAVPIQWERFQRNLPAMQSFFAEGNLALLIGTMLVTKAVHELAHATVCRRMGARCGEIGILLLCGTPCPYCDVTDSWRLPSAARRSAIMLAGIYVEFILAALASFVWWFTAPGTLHFAALNVMVVCSVSTFLFNLNPLMRYDGYYVLSDLIRSHHLRLEAAAGFRDCVIRPLAGPAFTGCSPAGMREWLLACYHVAATGYRIMISALIAIWVWHLADAIAIRPVGALAATGMLLAVPAASAKRWLSIVCGTGSWRKVRRVRRLLVAGILAGLVAFIFLVPVRRTQLVRGRVDVADALLIYVPETARIAEVSVGFGEPVSEGQVLARLENNELERQSLDLIGKRRAMELQIQQLRLQAIEQTSVLEQLDTQLATLDTVSEQADRAKRRIERLTLTARASGVLLPLLPSETSDDPVFRHDLFGSRGAWVQENAAWGRIANLRDCEVTLEIDSALRQSVELGGTVRLRCDQSPAVVVDAEITSVSTVHRTKQSLSGPQNRFRVACKLPRPVADQWRIGSDVTAQLELPRESLAHRLTRWWRETMRVG
ncbi:MAG: hypothetical protein WD119_01295 [Pirellulaceae bacterium]